jgi:hypothetical protein
VQVPFMVAAVLADSGLHLQNNNRPKDAAATVSQICALTRTLSDDG